MPDLQPNDHTAIVDIAPDPEVVLKSFSSRGRNAVRRAIREGAEVVTAEPTEENFRAMFNLMGQVQQGQKNVQVRSFEYFKAFWGNFIAAGQGRLLFTYEDGKPSVGAFVVNYGRKGTYKDGGSLPRRKQYGDSHLIQWTAMNQLKELGMDQLRPVRNSAGLRTQEPRARVLRAGPVQDQLHQDHHRLRWLL